MSATFTHLVARYGYLFIALILFIESAGVPIPGETALVTAAALAGGGRLSIVGVLLAAVFGTVTGGMTGYWMGVRGGQAVVARFGQAMRIDTDRLDRATRFFDRHGASALVVGRFIAIVRSFLGIFAGVAAMPPRRFALYNALGGLIWSLVFAAVGYLFGKNLPAVRRDLGRVSLVLALVVALVILLVVSWRWFSDNRSQVLSTMEARWRRLDARPWVLRLREKHPTVWRLFAFRFVRGEYLATHLFIGWLIALASLGVFGAITEDVVEGAPMTHADVALATALAASASAQLLAVLRIVGGIAGVQTIALVVAVVALILATRQNWLTFGAWITGYAGSVAPAPDRSYHRSDSGVRIDRPSADPSDPIRAAASAHRRPGPRAAERDRGRAVVSWNELSQHGVGVDCRRRDLARDLHFRVGAGEAPSSDRRRRGLTITPFRLPLLPSSAEWCN